VKEILDIHNKNEEDKKQAFKEGDDLPTPPQDEDSGSSNSSTDEALEMVKKPSKSLELDAVKVQSKLKKFLGQGHCHSDCDDCSDESCNDDHTDVGEATEMTKGPSI